MSEEAERAMGRAIWKVERAVVMQLLRGDRSRRWTVTELAEALSDIDGALVERALASLEGDGVIERTGEAAWASRAASRLDELELLGI